MVDNVTAEIIAIGTEILLGEITDTNSVYLAQQFRNLGVNVYYMTTVGDNRQRIADAIRLASSRADIIITCGGLGPTIDDMTRQSVADATDRELEFHQALYDQIAERFAMYKVKMTVNNNRQAYLPQSAMIIENPVGTAPSFAVEHKNNIIISLPGVPRELKFLFQSCVIPLLRDKYQLGTIQRRLLKTAGIGESTLDDMIGDDLLNASNPSIGLAAHHGIIDIRITAKADDDDTASAMIDAMEAKIRARVGQFIFGTDESQLEHVLRDLLLSQDATIAVYEAGITNAVIDKLSANDASAIIGNITTHRLPIDVQNDYPHTSEMTLRETAHHIATHLQKSHNTQASIVILSHPDINENKDTDVATVVAVYANGEIKSRVYGFGSANPLTADWVSRWAMAYTWRQLKEQFNDA